MDGFTPEEKMSRVYAIADMIADYASGNDSSTRALFVAPIDHGGWTQAWEFLKLPLLKSCHDRDIELIYTETPLNQSAGYGKNGEYRPILDDAKDIRAGSRKRIGRILMLDSSASRDPFSKMYGPSIMGGIVWALENLAYFGNDGEDVKVASALIRDYCPNSIANFSCFEESETWIGPKRALKRMNKTFKSLGGNQPDSPLNALADVHMNPERADIKIPEARIHLEQLGLDRIFGSSLENVGDIYPI